MYELRRSFLYYTLASFVSSGLPFLIMPLLTQYLSPADYGALRLVVIYTAVLVPLIGQTAMAVLNVEYFNRDPAGFADIVVTGFTIVCLGFALSMMLVVFGGNGLATLLEIPTPWLIVTPMLALLTIFSEAYLGLLIYTKAAAEYCLMVISRSSVEVGLTLLFVVAFGWSWHGRLISWAIVLLIMAGYSVLLFSRKGMLSGSLRRDDIRMAVAFGLPLIPHQLGKFVINQSDSLFLAKMVSMSEMGIYSIGYQLGTIVLVVTNILASIYTPFLFERLADLTEVKKIEIVRFSWLFIFSLASVVGLITLLAPWLFATFIEVRFVGAVKYVFWIGLSYFFWGCYVVFTGFVVFHKKNHILAWLAGLNVLLNLILNYFCIRVFGAIGAAYATTISFFVVFIAIAFQAHRLCPMPWFRLRALLRRA